MAAAQQGLQGGIQQEAVDAWRQPFAFGTFFQRAQGNRRLAGLLQAAGEFDAVRGVRGLRIERKHRRRFDLQALFGQREADARCPVTACLATLCRLIGFPLANLVASHFLGVVTGCIRCGQEIGNFACLAADGGQADTGTDRKDLVLPDETIGTGQGAQIIGNLPCPDTGAVAENDPEFVAAQSPQDVVVAQPAIEELGDLTQEFVTGKVAAGVVYRLETIQIDEEQAARVAAGLYADQAAFQTSLEFTAVEQAGQGIVTGLESQLCRGFLDPGLQRQVGLFNVGRHDVEALFQSSDFGLGYFRHAGREIALRHLVDRSHETVDGAGQIVGQRNRDGGDEQEADDDDHQTTQQQRLLTADELFLVQFDEDLANGLVARFPAQRDVKQGIGVVQGEIDRRPKTDPVLAFVNQPGVLEGLAQGVAGQRDTTADGNDPSLLIDDDGGLDAGLLDDGLGEAVKGVGLPGDDAVLADLGEVTDRGQGFVAQFTFQGSNALESEIGDQRDRNQRAGQEREQQQSLAQIESGHLGSRSESRARRRVASSESLRSSDWATVLFSEMEKSVGDPGGGSALPGCCRMSAVWRAIWAGVE